MSSTTSFSETEVKQLVEDWYAKLDVHAPVGELLPMLADANLEMRFPEATVLGHVGFTDWYEGVTRRFFDEVHVLKEVNVASFGEQAEVQLVVNWQAKVWNPPAPRSQWLGFNAAQRWMVTRSSADRRPLITTYIVDSLTPMEGSASL
jgi:hypothetical protein